MNALYVNSPKPTLSIPHLSAFLPVRSSECPNKHAYSTSISSTNAVSKSFIIIRERQKVHEAIKPIEKWINEGQKSDHDDYNDSTHHSHEWRHKSQDRRRHCLNSIKNLIEARRADTLSELERYDNDSIILKASPKKHSSNSKLSNFRGVSNNGRKWQVMIMGFAKKIYFGGISNEHEASIKYDKYAILMHGLEVRYTSNFIIYRPKRIILTIRASFERF